MIWFDSTDFSQGDCLSSAVGVIFSYTYYKVRIVFLNCHKNFLQDCKSVLSVYITVNSVSWTLIDKTNYEVQDWKYHGIDYPDGKKFQITDILDIVSSSYIRWDILKVLSAKLWLTTFY